VSQTKDAVADPDPSVMLSMYRLMVLTRVFEGHFLEWFENGSVREEPYVGIGQEAVGVGACAVLEPDDMVLPSLRGRPQFLARGVSLQRLIATILGRTGGFSEARMTSDHVADPEHGIIGGVGIVGSGIPIAVGAAVASRLKHDRRVTMVFFGDGATNTGAFHEGLNFAGANLASIVFICENNQYALSTPFATASRVAHISQRASGYGFPGVTVDGNDVLSVYKAAHEAVTRARQGKGPSLIECVTYRLNSHCPSISDTRDPMEVVEWKKHCPIRQFEKKLLDSGLLSSDDVASIAASCEEEVRTALAEAETSLYPVPSDATRHVYWEGETDA